MQEIVTQPPVISRRFSGLCIHSNEPNISVLIKLEIDRIDSVKLYFFFLFVFWFLLLWFFIFIFKTTVSVIGDEQQELELSSVLSLEHNNPFFQKK